MRRRPTAPMMETGPSLRDTRNGLSFGWSANGVDFRPAPERPPRRLLALARIVPLFAAGPLLVLLLLGPLVAVPPAASRAFNQMSEQIPLPPSDPLVQSTYLYDRDGRLLTTLHGPVNRTSIPLARMPRFLRHAVIAVEDKDFYREGGINLGSIIRAGLVNLSEGSLSQGGSTITQQYVKNVYLGNERTFERKIREALLAEKLSRMFTKNEILERYLNTVYFGHGAYGVEAAAKTYFGVRARDLSRGQSALLAGLIAAPVRFDPSNDPGAARARRAYVLDRMVEEGYLSPTASANIKRQKIVLAPRVHPNSYAYPAAYFVDHVRRDLEGTFGAERTFGGGLRVATTIDLDWQRAAEAAVASHLPSPSDPSAALVAIDPTNGEIRAMVGGRDFRHAKFNLATQALRTTGSAFKAFTLAAAMEQRISLKSVWKGPGSMVIDDPRCFDYSKGEPWDVSNYGESGAGTLDLVSATAHSVNTIFAQLAVEVGPDRIVDVAHRMGIQSELQEVCSITLGTQAVTPLEMTAGYATLAARGVYRPPTSIRTVRGPGGSVLRDDPPRAEQAIDPNDADLVTFALQRVVTGGTGTGASIGRPVAGKTGTAEFYVDAWFCGYTPQLATCVWVGYPAGLIPMHNVEGYANVFGGSIPAAIWREFMSVAMAELPVLGFATPDFSRNTVIPEVAGATPSPSPTPTPEKSTPPPADPTPTPTCDKQCQKSDDPGDP